MSGLTWSAVKVATVNLGYRQKGEKTLLEQ